MGLNHNRRHADSVGFSAMRMTSKIDCRRFAAEPAYRQAPESELCGDVPSRRPAHTIPAGKAVKSIAGKRMRSTATTVAAAAALFAIAVSAPVTIDFSGTGLDLVASSAMAAKGGNGGGNGGGNNSRNNGSGNKGGNSGGNNGGENGGSNGGGNNDNDNDGGTWRFILDAIEVMQGDKPLWPVR